MRINVPILHTLHPVNTSIPLSECLVDMASLVVVVLHVWVHLTPDICHRSSKKALCDVRTNIVKVIRIVVNGA